jgi:hypothetical protein
VAERPGAPSVLELERALTDLGPYVAYPSTPNLSSRVAEKLARRPARLPLTWWESWRPNQRRLAYALVALIALAVAVLAISPEARTAVAERLGLRGVLIREVPAIATPLPSAPTPVAASPAVPTPTPSAGARLSLGQAVSLDQARARVQFQFPLPTSIGTPDEVYVLDTPPGGQVALVYYPRADLPQTNTTGIGLLFTAFQGTVPSGMFGKGVPPGTTLEELQVNGGQGYWIAGDLHTIFYLDSRGQGRTETTRLASNVLVWDQGQLTLRIESSLSKVSALAIAASVN